MLGWLLVVVAGCLVGMPAARAAAATFPAAAVPRLDWRPCAGPVPAGFECASAGVPLDYRRPGGPKIRLAVIRHPASDRAHRIGSVFFNPGGPGASGVSVLPSVVAAMPDVLTARFDWVSWDPRGAGASTAVQCFASYAAEVQFFGGIDPRATFPVGRAEQLTWLDRYRRFGRLCAARNGSLLEHVSTADSARDMDLLRRAVGDRMLNYLGGSYGTFLGATYANLFPGRVRAMSLRSNVDPVAWVSAVKQHGRFLSTSLRENQDQGSAVTLRAFLDMCGQVGTARCAFSAGSAAATEAKYAALLRRTPLHPAHGIGYAELVAGTVRGLYDSGAWSTLGQGLQLAWTAASPAAQSRSALDPSGGRYAGFEQAMAILCSESPNPPAAAFPDLESFAYRRSGAVGSWWAWAYAACGSWPAHATDLYTGPWNRRTAHPILVIGNTYDPATPYSNSVTMAHTLARTRLLTVDGYGHGPGAHSPCQLQYQAEYFIAGTLPPVGARCQQAPPPFAPSTTLDQFAPNGDVSASSAWPDA